MAFCISFWHSNLLNHTLKKIYLVYFKTAGKTRNRQKFVKFYRNFVCLHAGCHMGPTATITFFYLVNKQWHLDIVYWPMTPLFGIWNLKELPLLGLICHWSFYIYYFLFIQLLFIIHKRNLGKLLFSFVKAFLHLWLIKIKEQSLCNRQQIILIMSSFFLQTVNQIFCFLKMLEIPFQIL